MLETITRSNADGDTVSYIPDVSLARRLPEGSFFIPFSGEFVKNLPKSGQVVIISH